jgi:hypothetical protein
MGILTYIKIGAAVIIITIAGYFILNYQHMKKVVDTQKYQIEQLEAAEKYYKAQPKIDAHTKEMQNEVKKAVDAGDLDRVKWLYNQLRMHKSTGPGKGKTPAPTDDDGTDE